MASSCEEDPKEGQLELIFKLRYEGEDLVMFDRIQYPDGRAMFIDRFTMFISSLELDDRSIKEVDFINMTLSHIDATSAADGYSYVIDKLPPADYTSISFDIGVPAELNAMKPLDFDRDHPLFQLNDYWDGWESYVFFKIEGKIDLDGDNQITDGIALHVGADETLRNVQFDKSISIKDGETTQATIEIDLHTMFTIDGEIYNIDGTSQIHNLTQLPVAIELADRLQKTVEIQ